MPRLIKTHCPYCSLQCGVTLDVSGERVTLAPQHDFPTNRGGLCAKGWTAAELLNHPDRLTRPLVRDDRANRASPLRPATWDEALERIVDAFQRTQQRYGRDAVGCFG
ncbi:MAG: molybdopterin-dependent oxidoreductase, partial [Mycolicibacterium sp.]|nr:molybdopterin-dependent oxidoreductase [Mycolicibacterium sp.]